VEFAAMMIGGDQHYKKDYHRWVITGVMIHFHHRLVLTPKIGTGERLICGPNLVTNPV
jgi:hypothetical protein